MSDVKRCDNCLDTVPASETLTRIVPNGRTDNHYINVCDVCKKRLLKLSWRSLPPMVLPKPSEDTATTIEIKE